MSCATLSVRVLNGRNNTTTLVFGRKTGTVVALYDFSDVTRMTLEFDAVVVDSALSPIAIVWGTTNGEVVLDLGGEGIAAGSYDASLFLYSPTYADGFLLDNAFGYTFNMDVI